MCRFLLYKGLSAADAVLLADLLVRPSHSIIKQSFACRERTDDTSGLPHSLNADGFGLGWYPLPTTPAGDASVEAAPSVGSKRTRDEREAEEAAPPEKQAASKSGTRAGLRSLLWDDSPALKPRRVGELPPPLSLDGSSPGEGGGRCGSGGSDEDDSWEWEDGGAVIEVTCSGRSAACDGVEECKSAPVDDEAQARPCVQVKEAEEGACAAAGVCDEAAAPPVKKRRVADGSGGDSVSAVWESSVPAGASPSSLPGVFTSTTPAWNNRNLVVLSERITSSCVFGHVRAASLGSYVTDMNCHPFQVGCLLFMHNGAVSAFSRLRRRILTFVDDDVLSKLQGTTDSEHCFAVFLTLLHRAGLSLLSPQPAELLAAALEDSIRLLNRWSAEAGITTPSLLNFAVTDGRTVVASRYVNKKDAAPASLYMSCGTRWARAGEHYRMMKLERRDRVVILASERLTGESVDWMPVPRNMMVVITPQVSVRLHPIASLLSAPGELSRVW
eukprot:PLAT7200.1.p1 GENE.PLAT7200.1~~PLAT7200.1.p1  ORF type:complete len:500 (+),score=237.63 PLAT7200.1:67-1566(+)